MICPRCEEGKITKVVLREKGEAMLCDSCESLWLKGESIKPTTGHSFRSFADDLDWEHAIQMSDQDEDQEHEPAAYNEHK